MDLATETHDVTFGSLIMTHGPQISGDVMTGDSTISLAGGTAYASLGIYPTFPTLGVVNFGMTTGTSPAPTVDGHIRFKTQSPVITINDTLVPDPADDLVVTADITSDQPLYDATHDLYYIPGLREGRLPLGWDETNGNFGSWIALSPRMAETGSSGALPSVNPVVPGRCEADLDPHISLGAGRA